MILAATMLSAGLASGVVSPSWTIQPTANPGGVRGSHLYSVACVAAADCTGVGFYRNTQPARVPLIEHRNGSTWTPQPAPAPPGTRASILYGLSCSSTNACTAVGQGFLNGLATTVSLAERWNGATWAIQATPNPGGANSTSTNSVACPAVNSCTIVGYYYVDAVGDFAPLVEHWDGSTWRVQAVPSPPGPGFLYWVSCTAANACTAVGGYYDRTGTVVPLAERWNGATWTIQPTPSVAGATQTNFYEVSCAAVNACMAVGSFYTSAGGRSTLAERWNGTSWAIVPSPNVAGATLQELYGVSCPAAGACTATGYSVSAGAAATLAEHWDGASWTIQPTPNPAGGRHALLNDLACSSPVACVAVGGYTSSDGTDLTLAEVFG